MLNGVFSWFRDRAKSMLPKCLLAKEAADTKRVEYYLIDPTAKDLVGSCPLTEKTIWPVTASGYSAGHSLGSEQQQAASLREMVNKGVAFLLSKCPRQPKGWARTSSLRLMPRRGVDANAYYDGKSLSFFHFPSKSGSTVYSCDSMQISTHEFGHAFLDSLRPDLWNVAAFEAWAFHEAFGDAVCVFCVTADETVVRHAWKETGGDLRKSNIITRMGVQMGLALNEMQPGNALPNGAIRDMSVKYQYARPESLPRKGEITQLLAESHSFGRVFASMVYALILEIADDINREKKDYPSSFMAARDITATILVRAVSRAPIVPRFYNSVCQEMLVADHGMGAKNSKAIRRVFGDFKIMSPVLTMLSERSVEEEMAKPGSELEEIGDKVAVRSLGIATSKVSNAGVSAQSEDRLSDVIVELAQQSGSYFGEDGRLEVSIMATDEEAHEAAAFCLELIRENGMLDGDQQIFDVVDGKLVRKQIAGCGCNKPNYCIPGAPEYQKPWKPKNNAGCVKCRNQNCQPRPCDCPSPQPTPAPSPGCFTNASVGQRKTYRVGSRASRRVC